MGSQTWALTSTNLLLFDKYRVLTKRSESQGIYIRRKKEKGHPTPRSSKTLASNKWYHRHVRPCPSTLYFPICSGFLASSVNSIKCAVREQVKMRKGKFEYVSHYILLSPLYFAPQPFRRRGGHSPVSICLSAEIQLRCVRPERSRVEAIMPAEGVGRDW